MAIPSVRFSPLEEEYNVAMTTVKQSNPTEILNSASNTINTASADLLKTISQITQNLDINNFIRKITDLKNSTERDSGLTKFLSSIAGVEGTFRRARGLLKSTFDTNKAGIKHISNLVNGIFSHDPISQSLMRLMNTNLGNKIAGDFTIGKPFKPVVSLSPTSSPPPGSSRAVSIGDSSHNYKDIITVINRNTGNALQQTVVDPNNIVRQAVMLGNLAYDANMREVMLALKNIPGMTPEILSRVLAIIMTEQASKGNGAAIIDISNGSHSVLGTEPVAPIHASPSILSDTFSNFITPVGSTDQNSVDIIDALIDTAGHIDQKWNVSD